MSVVGKAWAPLQRRAAAGHVAGARLLDALAVGRELGRRGIRTTIGYWDRSGEPAEQVAAVCLEAVRAIPARPVGTADCYLSIKVPSLGFDAGLIGELLAVGAERGVALHYDAKAPEAADATFALLDAGPPFAPRPGCTLPGGWVRSPADAERVRDLGGRVRVVKGQWLDPAERFSARGLRSGCLEVVDRLAGRSGLVAIATHDGALAAEALGRLVAAGTPCELELLYGLGAGGVLRATRRLAVPVRVYIPFGQAYLPYPLWRVGSEPRLARYLAGDLLGRRAARGGGQVRSYAGSLTTSRDGGAEPAQVRSAGGEASPTGGSRARRPVP